MNHRDTPQRWAGLDVLRIGGCALVVAQHALSITDHQAYTAVAGLRYGRLGTTLFFVIAGYLAAVSTRSPQVWLGQRLRTLLPPYWIVLAASFVGVAVTQYKSFDAWQVLCQFSCVGLFTHPDRLVNVPTWFISAILILYLVTYLARCTSEKPVIGLAMALMAAAGLLWPERFNWVWFAGMFLVAYSIPLLGFSAVNGALSWAAILAAAALAVPSLWHGAVVLLLFAAGACWQSSSRPAAALADYSYEWFLVHGPALHVARQLLGGELWGVVALSAAITCGGVVVLRQLTHFCELAAVQLMHHLRGALPSATARWASR